jgi:hypothetical protein
MRPDVVLMISRQKLLIDYVTVTMHGSVNDDRGHGCSDAERVEARVMFLSERAGRTRVRLPERRPTV